jgi:hypothetical protein
MLRCVGRVRQLTSKLEQSLHASQSILETFDVFRAMQKSELIVRLQQIKAHTLWEGFFSSQLV